MQAGKDCALDLPEVWIHKKSTKLMHTCMYVVNDENVPENVPEGRTIATWADIAVVHGDTGGVQVPFASIAQPEGPSDGTAQPEGPSGGISFVSGVLVPSRGTSFVSVGVQATPEAISQPDRVERDVQLEKTLETVDTAASRVGFPVDLRVALPDYIKSSNLSLQICGSLLQVKKL